MSYQKILIQGNCTRDAEVRQVGQSQVAKIGVAVSERFRKQDGTIGENVEYFDVEIWDKPGVYPYLVKGASVLIDGAQKTDRWQDQNGQNREAKKIRAQVVQLCGPRPQSAPQQSAPAYQQAPSAPAPTYQAPPAPPQAPVPPAQPAYQQAPPAPPQQYPPMNSPEYSQPDAGDLPF